eukprot:NODE_378_length_8478_cov_0.790070.p2 type:complete len:640 gc:universal NODE_378_length_8478_cov_0.790070:3422-1503(-)
MFDNTDYCSLAQRCMQELDLVDDLNVGEMKELLLYLLTLQKDLLSYTKTLSIQNEKLTNIVKSNNYDGIARKVMVIEEAKNISSKLIINNLEVIGIDEKTIENGLVNLAKSRASEKIMDFNKGVTILSDRIRQLTIQDSIITKMREKMNREQEELIEMNLALLQDPAFYDGLRSFQNKNIKWSEPKKIPRKLDNYDKEIISKTLNNVVKKLPKKMDSGIKAKKKALLQRPVTKKTMLEKSKSDDPLNISNFYIPKKPEFLSKNTPQSLVFGKSVIDWEFKYRFSGRENFEFCDVKLIFRSICKYGFGKLEPKQKLEIQPCFIQFNKFIPEYWIMPLIENLFKFEASKLNQPSEGELGVFIVENFDLPATKSDIPNLSRNLLAIGFEKDYCYILLHKINQFSLIAAIKNANHTSEHYLLVFKNIFVGDAHLNEIIYRTTGSTTIPRFLEPFSPDPSNMMLKFKFCSLKNNDALAFKLFSQIIHIQYYDSTEISDAIIFDSDDFLDMNDFKKAKLLGEGSAFYVIEDEHNYNCYQFDLQSRIVYLADDINCESLLDVLSVLESIKGNIVVAANKQFDFLAKFDIPKINKKIDITKLYSSPEFVNQVGFVPIIYLYEKSTIQLEFVSCLNCFTFLNKISVNF